MSPACNCPPMADVSRGRVTGTKPPCPVHPEPANLGDILQPLIRPVSFAEILSFKPGTDFYNGRSHKGRARRS